MADSAWRGVSVFPGYRDAPELSAQAFDEGGWYRIGDAACLLDEARPEAGAVCDGRVAEDAKLTIDTWVSVGMLQLKPVSALAPQAQDAVFTGHDRDSIGALLFPSAVQGAGSAQTPARLRRLDEPPDADAGEITGKGCPNQRAVPQRRAAEVDAL